jgi:hypothetical protein
VLPASARGDDWRPASALSLFYHWEIKFRNSQFSDHSIQ